MPYTGVPTEICRSLIWLNISWSNISTSIINRSTCSITMTPNYESVHPQMWFREGIQGNDYVDVGAEVTDNNVEIHVGMKPTSNKPATIGDYKRDKNHLVEEIRRVIRQNRANASGYDFIFIPRGGIIPRDVEDDPDVNPPYLETIIRVTCRKIREELS